MIRVTGRHENEIISIDKNIIIRCFTNHDDILYILSQGGTGSQGYESKASVMEKKLFDLMESLNNRVIAVHFKLADSRKPNLIEMLKNLTPGNYLAEKETRGTWENYTFRRDSEQSSQRQGTDADKELNSFVNFVFGRYNILEINIVTSIK